jgi:prepilin-type N-terminal cleavage/methylation domain-containing protein
MGRDAGFTLVELLVVMLVLALLIAIAIPSFFQQTHKAKDAGAKAAAHAAHTAAETIATDNHGDYDGPNGVTVANLRSVEDSLNSANLSVSGVAQHSYTITVHSTTGNDFDVERHNDGSTSFPCTVAGTFGCPMGGNWGQ